MTKYSGFLMKWEQTTENNEQITPPAVLSAGVVFLYIKRFSENNKNFLLNFTQTLVIFFKML